MEGKALTQIVDRVLLERGISRSELCKAIGITSASYTGWKNGSKPRQDKIEAIEKFLDIDLSAAEEAAANGMDPEMASILQTVRDRQDIRILLRSASSVPASSVYQLIAQLEKMKEDGNV